MPIDEEILDEIADSIESWFRAESTEPFFYEWAFNDFKDNIGDFEGNDTVPKDIVEAFSNDSDSSDIYDEAKEAGITDAQIYEMLLDRSKMSGDRGFITLYSLDSGDEERDLVDIAYDIESEVLTSLTQTDVDYINDKITRNTTVELVLRNQNPVLKYNMYLEAFLVLNRAGYESVAEQLREAIESKVNEVPQSDARGPDVDAIVFKSAHKNFQGYYLADLPASALKDEGSRQRICVGDPEQGYIGLVKKGKKKIMSFRKPNGETLFTFEFDVDSKGNIISCEQVKGKANRLPGFDNAGGNKKFIKPKEVEVVIEILDHLGVDTSTVDDLEPGVRAYEAQNNADTETQPQVTSSFMEENHIHCGFCNTVTASRNPNVIRKLSLLISE